MSVCQYFLQGRCAYGSRCRNIHTTPNGGTRSAKPGEADDVNPYNLLSQHWSRLAWKGSPVWGKNPDEPIFHGLNLSIEELRLEFYRRPEKDWAVFQRNFENQLEELRRSWIRQNTSGQARRTSQQWGVSLSQIFPTPAQYPSFLAPTMQTFPHGMSPQNVTLTGTIPMPFTNSTLSGSLHPAVSQAPVNQLFGVTSTSPSAPGNPLVTASSFPVSFTASAVNPPTLQSQNQPLSALPIQGSTTLMNQPAASMVQDPIDSKLEYLRQRYPNELVGYDAWEIKAFLASDFSAQGIPVKPPPPGIPELF